MDQCLSVLDANEDFFTYSNFIRGQTLANGRDPSMIIRVDDELRRAVQRAEGGIRPSNLREADADAVAILVPDWLRPMIVSSDIIIIDADEWLSIEWEVKQHISEMRPGQRS